MFGCESLCVAFSVSSAFPKRAIGETLKDTAAPSRRNSRRVFKLHTSLGEKYQLAPNALLSRQPIHQRQRFAVRRA
jgi:hypothetical protein